MESADMAAPTFTNPNRTGQTHHVQGSTGPSVPIYWRCEYELKKFAAGAADVRAGVYGSSAGLDAGRPVAPYEQVVGAGNMLVNGGADLLWLNAMSPGSTVANAARAYLDNGNAGIGVGNSTAAVARTQTNLQGASKARKGMETTYPTHTTGTASTGARDIVLRALFSTAQANFAWNEWGVFNSTTEGQGRMVNRKVEALGTKTTAASWQFSVKLSLTT
jgi:hypothetical protein